MIILKTIKGKGVSFIESAKVSSHSMPVTKEMLEKAYAELE
jgi:transketolase